MNKYQEIKTKTIEEMAKFIFCIANGKEYGCYYCVYRGCTECDGITPMICIDGIKKYLQQPAEGDFRDDDEEETENE